ncbi:TlpA family protein disulfide reductase [Candidatus Protofrankia californiensis]|uniref:TlpA family protein disulfide reductase n=1 Tax=Candidatus Protofrankia californiensis TaxID=1839754 RepID=UPI0010410653|nr:TlpA disulfide reductase family protein [Candidatus Protofrankia californiensis]
MDGRQNARAASGVLRARVGRVLHRRRPLRFVCALCASVLMTVASVLVTAACSSGSDSVDQAAGGGFGFVQQAPNSDFVPVGSRKPAPELTGPTVAGPDLSLVDFRGKITVVNFWASWCAPCRAETPGLVRMAADNPEVAFVGVNEKDNLSAAKAFIRDNGVIYPSIVDRIGTLAARWPVPPGLPSTFVLDGEGRLAARFTGGVLPDELTPVLARLRAET